jgi:hypothetical protein
LLASKAFQNIFYQSTLLNDLADGMCDLQKSIKTLDGVIVKTVCVF